MRHDKINLLKEDAQWSVSIYSLQEQFVITERSTCFYYAFNKITTLFYCFYSIITTHNGTKLKTKTKENDLF